MKKKDPANSDDFPLEINAQFEEHNKYFDFFEHAPIALYIEDFSKVKEFVLSKAKEQNVSVKTYIEENPEIIQNIHYLVIIKEVNAATVKLFKAKGKKDLLQNLEHVFTPDSSIGFGKLVSDILLGQHRTVVETVNKTLEGDEIFVSIKYNVQQGSEQTLKNVIVSIEDITERVKANRALAISKKRYKESQEVAKIASWFYDFNSRHLFWSDEVYEMLSVDSKKQHLDISYYLSFVHPEDREIVNDFSIKNLLNNPTQNLNYRIVTSKGGLKYVYEKRSIIIEDGKVNRIIGICQDITERILSEKRLNATKKLLSNTLSSIHDAFAILDNNSNYLYVNKAATELLGRSEQELIGKNIWVEFPEKEGDLFYDNYQIAFKTKKPISFENYFAPWNRWFENRMIPSNDTMLIFFHETTTQKETESKIKTAYNIINKSSSVAILCKNAWNFPVVFASRNADKLFGYSSNEFLSQQIKIHELVHPEDLEKLQSYFLKLIKDKLPEEIEPKSFRIITKNGITKWIETSLDVIRNSNNKITHVQGIAEDITARKRAETQLFKSNQRLQDQFNNTPLASIIWDLDFKVLEWNNSAHRIFGYSEKEAKGNHAKDLIIPSEILNDINNIWQTLLAQEGGNRNTNENITKSGATIICDWYNVTLKDPQGNVVGVASLVNDITERISSKNLLEKSEKKYRDIFEKSVDAVLILKNGLFIDCNESTLEMFEYPNKMDLSEIHPSKLSPENQPDQRNSFDKANEMIQFAIEKGSHRFRWYHQRKNGQVFPAEVSLTKIEEGDNTVTIHAVVKDITERVKKEEIETILYNISKAALSNDDFSEFGKFIKEELHKIIDTSNFYIAFLNDDKDRFYTPYMVDEKEDVTEFEAEGTLTNYVVKTQKSLMFTNKTHRGLMDSGLVGLIGVDSKIWLGVPLKSKNEVFGAIVVQSYTNEKAYNDNDVQLLEFVSEQISSAIQRKNSENELRKTLIKAQESDRLKSAFLANMSHEIRTPMNGIIGFSELFLDPDLNYSERKEYAQIVINSSQKLLSIVNDILDISKIEAGVVQLNYSHVNINALLNELEQFYYPISKEKKLKLICKKGLKNFESTIDIDKTKLNQVITNLLSNAFKFTENGQIEFGYELKDKTLVFFVKDTGVGISEKLHSKIFDRFIQANENFEKQNKGTGLGLAISKRFVELFKGKIWIESSSKGTNVFFNIPYTKVRESMINTVIEQRVKKTISNNEINILVAEDEEYNMLYINELFSKTNFKVIEAFNGNEAVEIVKNNQNIDLILMDIKMPIMNGNDAMKAIKKIKPNIPIIALSAFAMESDRETAIASGFDSYLSKPLNKKLLFDQIETFVK